MAQFTPGNRTSGINILSLRKLGLLSFILFLIFLIAQSPFIKRWMYPVMYKDEVIMSARAHQVDPYLIMAVIRAESNFKPNVRSPKGAFGLMQLMPETAQWAVEEGEFSPDFINRLQEPAVNIHIGSWYLRILLEQFEDRPIAAIAAYNAGPGRVERWLDEGGWSGQMADIDVIPYKETRQYVQRVLYYYSKYKEVHPDLQMRAHRSLAIERNEALRSHSIRKASAKYDTLINPIVLY